MVKDIQYFLEKEQEFCEAHPDYGKRFFDKEIGEMSEIGINDSNHFLHDKVINKYFSIIGAPIGNEESLELTDAQRVCLRMFYGRYSVLFRDDYYYNGITEVVQNLLDTLDSVVELAPKNTDSVLYRFCNEHDRTDMNIGDIITFHHNLTCTNFDWEQGDEKNVYIITPLKDNSTKAHNLYEIFEHGDEKQVDFKRGTSFQVENIEDTEGTGFKKIYMQELPSIE